MLYRSNLMVPLWVVLQVADATALYDPTSATLRLTSFDGGLRSGKLGQGPPADWGRTVKWRDYLRDAAAGRGESPKP